MCLLLVVLPDLAVQGTQESLPLWLLVGLLVRESHHLVLLGVLTHDHLPATTTLGQLACLHEGVVVLGA